MERSSRHRNILNLYNQHPQISPSAYIAPNATVYGDVFVGQNSYFAFGSVANALANPIRVGTNTKIGEGTVLETNIIGND
jgi:carbonic anhydrase/acetyltransferase-like protein (isoleucine patch superfamily)